MNSLPLVSVVIPTYNSERTLAKCLESIKNQIYKNVEAIVVDNYSKDKTVEIAKRYGAKIIKKKCNKPEARNIGILILKGDYILLLDSDMMLEKEVVEEGVAKFYNEGCDALFINEEYLDDGFLKKCRNLEKIVYRENPIIEAPRFYKKSLALKTFFDDRNEGPDEYDFYISLQSRFSLKESRINSKLILLEPPINLKKKFHHGKFFMYYRRKHKNKAIPSKQINFHYRIKILLRAFRISPLHFFRIIFHKISRLYSFFIRNHLWLF